MLRRLNAFYNDRLGEDRYTAIFERKQELDKKRTDPQYSDEERRMFNIEREGTKLILNSATGAADPREGQVPSSIRMNNRIRSMRIIGQLFTYMIGQAQTYAGARIVSTNTDGLYSVLDADLNRKILAKEAAEIGVEIVPEELYLVSKDSNNRLEASPDLTKILSASGSLACRKDTSPTKSLAHPAIIDWALSRYLLEKEQTWRRLLTGTWAGRFWRKLRKPSQTRPTGSECSKTSSQPTTARSGLTAFSAGGCRPALNLAALQPGLYLSRRPAEDGSPLFRRG